MINDIFDKKFNFNKTIILDIANNHFGKTSHGIDIIKRFSELNYPDNYTTFLNYNIGI